MSTSSKRMDAATKSGSRRSGGDGSDEGRSVQQTADGGYIIAGWFTTPNVPTGEDVYLIKTDSDGNQLWSKTFGGVDVDLGFSVQQTTDGGYIVVGRLDEGSHDEVYLIKTDELGNELWSNTFGGSERESGYSVEQIADGGYVITGNTRSFGEGDYDVYLVKTDEFGNELWSKTFGGSEMDGGGFVRQTSDGGYIVAGWTASFGAGDLDAYLIYYNPEMDVPVIRKLRPRSPEPGETVRIIGENFCDMQGETVVHIGRRTFGSSSARIKLWTNSKIKVQIPDYKCKWFKGQDYRNRKVWVTVDGIDSNKKRLKVMKPPDCLP